LTDKKGTASACPLSSENRKAPSSFRNEGAFYCGNALLKMFRRMF